MQRLIGLCVCMLVAIGALTSPSFAATPARLIPAKDQDKAIADQYIVVLKDGPSISAASVTQSIGVSPKYTYNGVINGFTARLTPRQLKALQNNPQVDYIEQDSEISAGTAQPEGEASIEATQPVSSGLWGLDRIDQPIRPLSGSYTYNTTASNVTAYVIDSGIYTQHMDFGGRATNVYDAIDFNGQDCYGRGTHLAGTIGGATHGVAKEVQLRGVRVLDCFGYGTMSGILAGIDYVRVRAVKPAIAIMVVNGGISATIENAMTSLYSSGVYVVVHAGNNNANSCNYSPTRLTILMVVAASNNTDARASWSNYGACVDMYAPGVSVLSTWYGTYTGTRVVNGTEMAAAHVAGVAALYLGTNPGATMPAVTSWLNTNATPNVITGNPAGTPNRLLYKSTL